MSDTPRTDKEICEFAPTADPHYEGPIEWVPAWVAKELERELNESRAINAKLEEALIAQCEFSEAAGFPTTRARELLDRTSKP